MYRSNSESYIISNRTTKDRFMQDNLAQNQENQICHKTLLTAKCVFETPNPAFWLVKFWVVVSCSKDLMVFRAQIKRCTPIFYIDRRYINTIHDHGIHYYYVSNMLQIWVGTSDAMNKKPEHTKGIFKTCSREWNWENHSNMEMEQWNLVDL